MKITYTVPIGHSVRSIEGGNALAARQVVKTTLKNLKKWYARLRHGTTNRTVNFDQQNDLDEITISCHERTATIMIIDQEESRNRANENLENELREHLANNKSVIDDDDDGDR